MSFTGSATTRMPSRWLVARGGTGGASYRLLAQAHASPGHGCVYVLIGCAALRILCEMPPTRHAEAGVAGGAPGPDAEIEDRLERWKVYDQFRNWWLVSSYEL